MSILVEPNLLETLKCSLCYNYLSIPPITIISLDGKDQKCGRCEDINTGFSIRNYHFENLATIAKFPCMYSECEEILHWGEVKRHEEACVRRTLKCPMFQNCEEIVEVCGLLSHFEENHSENLYHSFSDEPIYFDTYTISMLVQECGQYLVARYFTTGIFWVQVFSLYSEENYEYELKLNCESGKFSNSFKSRVVLFKENVNCFKCSAGVCQEKSHKHSTLYNQSLSHLSTTVEAALESHNLCATINIIPYNTDISEGALSTNNNTSLIDRILQCPVCEEYMTPPIFICNTGHSICNVCRPQVDNCPTCRFPIETRNYILEDVADNAELFCQWKCEGCNFIGNAHRLSLHHQNCGYGNEISKIERYWR